MKGIKILFLTLAVFCPSIKADDEEKIVGGQPATQGQFPYQVKISFTFSKKINDKI